MPSFTSAKEIPLSSRCVFFFFRSSVLLLLLLLLLSFFFFFLSPEWKVIMTKVTLLSVFRREYVLVCNDVLIVLYKQEKTKLPSCIGIHECMYEKICKPRHAHPTYFMLLIMPEHAGCFLPETSVPVYVHPHPQRLVSYDAINFHDLSKLNHKWLNRQKDKTRLNHCPVSSVTSGTRT